MTVHIIPQGVRAISLARYLARAWPLTPGWVWRETLKKRDVRINGERGGAGDTVAGGDELTLYVPDKYLSGAPVVLHDDGRLIALNKPQGLPVDVDAQGVGADTLLTRAQSIYPTARLCHRLDAGTGGAVLLALNDDALSEAVEAFKNHTVEKAYSAVVVGQPWPAAGTLNDFLMKDARDALVKAVDGPRPGARRATLSYETAGVNYGGKPGLSLVEIALGTGRTHQIRVQAAHAGWPVLGDDKYGDRGANKRYGANEPFLWCARLTLHTQHWPDLTVRSACAFRSLRGESD